MSPRPDAPYARGLFWLLAAVAGGILLQAMLAGMFLAGLGVARTAHTFVGWLLPYLALVSTVVAWTQSSRGVVASRRALGVTVLAVALWVQETLGHMPFPLTIAIHVPLGAALLAYAVVLAGAVYVSRSQIPGEDG